jgi:Lrp/AsnC family transcriptional regulator, leucine-responsive regulatory protein
MAVRFVVMAPLMIGGNRPSSTYDSPYRPYDRILFCSMAISLDSVDIQLLAELQADADRPNVELARIVGLSPAATLHRVRRLKESGIVRGVAARLDSAAAGFALQVYVAVSLERHDDTAHRRFAQAVRAMPEVIAADWVTGETDAMLMVVAREVAELQRVLVRLSTRGGAQRVMTLLRLEELKPASPLPLEPTR